MDSVQIKEFMYNLIAKSERVTEDIYRYPLIYSASKDRFLQRFQSRFKEKSGFPTLPRTIRNTLVFDYYEDFDIVNCHPVLLYGYAKENNFEKKLSMLTEYFKARPILLEHSPELKKIVLKMFYGKKLTKEQHQIPLLRGLSKDLEKILDHFKKSEPELFISISKEKNYNIEGTALAILAFSLESTITETILNFFVYKG